ncbi:hypothetical protein MG296_13425 [Flavobacteriaceae bacterium TK19130]|nr:hypothetical protein [Thermobacterium salinum]
MNVEFLIHVTISLEICRNYKLMTKDYFEIWNLDVGCWMLDVGCWMLET